ncbi:acid phosphatase 1-like [Aristolochia californica]|uniref:acid phosphatase 1-like n=1 Tax=Aristolochia californica TaxID=171875 RepID=UPI0035D62221
MAKPLFLLLIVATFLSVSTAADKSRQIHPLRSLEAAGDHQDHGISCDSWRVAVETNNIREWDAVPVSCEFYVGNYMQGGLYRKDSAFIIDQAIEYAESLKLVGDGKDIWVFDIDETCLSNLPYYSVHGFGSEPYNDTLFEAWVYMEMAFPLPETLKLYNRLVSLGFKIVFLTGRTEPKRNSTVMNLLKAGYTSWEKLLLRGPSDSTTTALVFKSGQRQKLEEQGYRILGNIGDEWSDILGASAGSRTFKLPDPMYYIS